MFFKSFFVHNQCQKYDKCLERQSNLYKNFIIDGRFKWKGVSLHTKSIHDYEADKDGQGDAGKVDSGL